MKKKQVSKSQTGAKKSWFERVRKLALALPHVEEGTSYGTPDFRVGGKLFARLHQTEDSLVIRIEEADRRMRMEADPGAYYITDHYLNYPWMLVRVAQIYDTDLEELLRDAWQLVVPKRLLASSDKENS